jgi:hypothetical protein
MFEDVTQQTIDLLNKVPANGALSKTTISTTLAANGLNAFDLRGPAVNLYPVLTPLRNTLPREVSQQGDTATRWKAIVGVNTAINPIMTAGVQEGRRGGEISVTEQDFLATYAGLGLEASINWEAVWAGGKVFDNKATLTKALLNSVMIAEEMVLLGGNNSLALGICPQPSGTVSGSGTIPLQSSLLFCVALTLEGLRLTTSNINGLGLQPVLSTTTVKGQFTRTNIDGTTTLINGGNSQVSVASASIPSTANSGIAGSVPAVKGAAGYAWYLGTTAANAALAAITTTNTVTLTAPGAGTQFANDPLISADRSQNGTEFDGFLTLAQKTNSGAFYKSLDGAFLTSDGANGIVEIDAALQSFWDNARLSPSELWIHSQEARNINKKIINAGTSSLVRFTTQQANEPFIMGGASVAKYWNKFTAQWIDINIHPAMPAGTMLFKTNEIPYPMAEVGAVNLVRCRRDYYQIEWPFVSRQYVYGVYTDEVLVCRAPLSLGVIANIANG